MIRAGFKWAVVSTILLAFGLAGCEEEDFGKKEQKELERVIRTGVELETDPFVRAETLRVLELLGRKDLNDFARPRVEDSSPMVRVAALRVLMKTDASEVRRLTLAGFNQADDREKRAILNAALDYGSPPLQRELTARGMRASDLDLRRLAFEHGPAARIRQAREKQKTTYLENTLFPEIGRYVTSRDEQLAADALELLIESGQEDRADPLIETVKDESAEREDRLEAARILAHAGVEKAAPVFESMLGDLEVDNEGGFVLPQRRDEQMVRIATLGLVSIGEEEYVSQAQAYLKNAETEDSIEVLEALAENPAKAAHISLKIAMQDARKDVRFRAIELYGQREDARADALFAAMRGTDYESEKRIADILAKRFPEEWSEHLAEQLEDEKKRASTLRLMRDVLTSSDDARVIEPLKGQLTELASSEDKELASLAGISLVRVSDDPKIAKLLRNTEDEATRYAYLQHLVETDPTGNTNFFRDNFYSDLYVLRLMSGAGLLAAYQKDEAKTAASAKEAKAAEASTEAE